MSASQTTDGVVGDGCRIGGACSRLCDECIHESGTGPFVLRLLTACLIAYRSVIGKHQYTIADPRLTRTTAAVVMQVEGVSYHGSSSKV